MNKTLQPLIQSLYQEYQPLSRIDQQLIRQQDPNSFKNRVFEKTKDLQPHWRQRVEDELFGWGPLTPLLNKEDIFDIIIQGPESIFYEDSKGMHKHQDQFLSVKSFQNFIELLKKQAGLLIDKKDPFANGQVFSFRVHMIIPPVTAKTTITLRRHNQKTFSLNNLEQTGFVTDDQSSWLKKLIKKEENFLIVGPTGSGKTTFLNSLIQQCSATERLVIIEDTNEIICHLPLACKLLSRQSGPKNLPLITMENLVKQSLRMRPDRLIVGEVRGQEAKDLLQALATGHAGSMGTLHAQSAQQALLRLEMLVQMGAPQWSLHSIRQLIQMSLQYILVLDSHRQQKKLISAHRIRSHEKFGLLLEKVHF